MFVYSFSMNQISAMSACGQLATLPQCPTHTRHKLLNLVPLAAVVFKRLEVRVEGRRNKTPKSNLDGMCGTWSKCAK